LEALKKFYKETEIWAGGMAQAVEFLLSKYEALSSNPSTEKKKVYRKSYILEHWPSH
jgi:hypothetical protein